MRHWSSVLFAALLVLTSLATLPPAARAAKAVKLPPAEDDARTALEHSPRHGEYIDIAYAGRPPIRTWVVYPERADKAGVVLVIHEIFGLSDWIRAVTDRLAGDGFIALAPDLLAGLGPGGGGTDSVASRDDVVKLVRQLTPEESAARIAAVRAWAATIPSANGRLATLGFCWGGGRSFACAASEPPPQAAVVFYGSAPDSVQLPHVHAPVLAHYGGDDARINSTIGLTQTTLKKLGRLYETHVYPGAGHGFLRQQTLRDGANLRASQEAWPRTLAFLRTHLDLRAGRRAR
jgi:carboxymethylenebutenolidase